MGTTFPLYDLRAMNKPCGVARCTEPATGFSTLCDTHKKHQRRHGHAQQAAVTVHQLAPYVARVKARRAKNPTSDVWPILAARWDAVTENAQALAQRVAGGAAVVAPEAKAAEQWLRLAGNVPAEAVVDAVLGMYLMRDAEPRRFQSDRAFLFQLVRRVRGLAPVNAGSYWDAQRGRARKVYQDLPPRVVEWLADALVKAFGGAGLILAAKEREQAEAAQQDAQRLARALEVLA